MPRRSLQFPTQCHEQDCVLNVGQILVQIMRQSGSVLGANQQMVCQVALFLLSTGARLSEALQAQWSQVDRQSRVWRIPATNSKSKRVRSIPLNDSAIEVLDRLGTEGKFDHLFINLQMSTAI